MTLMCPIADRMAVSPALEVEDWLRAMLAANRGRDAAAGGALVGTHRSDMELADRRTGIQAAMASTGQQKALLLGVILSHARSIAEVRGFAPLLLLDEPAVHLDAARRLALFGALRELPAQVFMTGTDLEVFQPLAGAAEAWRTEDGALVEEKGFAGGTGLSSGGGV